MSDLFLQLFHLIFMNLADLCKKHKIQNHLFPTKTKNTYIYIYIRGRWWKVIITSVVVVGTNKRFVVLFDQFCIISVFIYQE